LLLQATTLLGTQYQVQYKSAD